MKSEFSVAPDWGAIGQYENVAEGLLPVSRAVVEAADLKSNDKVLDIGARTGNAALLAAESGADVTAIDFSPRLLGVARSRLKSHYPNARFELADVLSLPFDQDSFDAILDIVSLMFVADRTKAVSEMSRVLRQQGRIVWSSWTPDSPVVEALKIRSSAVAKIVGQPAYPYTYWSDQDDMDALFGEFGLGVKLSSSTMCYTAPSPQAWLEGLNGSHPLAIACSTVLEEAGVLQQTEAEMLEVLEARNEDQNAFKLSFRYVVGVASRSFL